MSNKQSCTNTVVHANAEDCCKVKIPVHYSCTEEHSALLGAAIHGDIERMKELISVTDPKNEDSYALRLAAEHGQIECVKLLIPVSDPKAKDSDALLMAVKNGNADIIKLLIPVSDPKATDSMSLETAVRFGYKQCILPLIPVSDLSWVFNNKKQGRFDPTLRLVLHPREEHGNIRE